MAIAALAIGALVAGCGEADVPGGRAQEEIQYGVWTPDADGAMRFTATADVPNEEDQVYGWRVRVAESEDVVKWIETVTLPEAPEPWKGVEDHPNVMIPDDRRRSRSDWASPRKWRAGRRRSRRFEARATVSGSPEHKAERELSRNLTPQSGVTEWIVARRTRRVLPA